MQILPACNNSPQTQRLVDGAFKRSRLSAYCDYRASLPVHLHESKGSPDLSVPAIHVFLDGFDDVDVDIVDPETGSDHFVVFCGDVRCRSLCTGNMVGIEGTLTSKVINGASGSNRLLVAKRIECILLFEDGHSFEAQSLSIDTVFSKWDLLKNPNDGSISRYSDDPTQLFVEAFYKLDKRDPEDSKVHFFELEQAILAGESWRKPDSIFL